MHSYLFVTCDNELNTMEIKNRSREVIHPKQQNNAQVLVIAEMNIYGMADICETILSQTLRCS